MSIDQCEAVWTSKWGHILVHATDSTRISVFQLKTHDSDQKSQSLRNRKARLGNSKALVCSGVLTATTAKDFGVYSCDSENSVFLGETNFIQKIENSIVS